VIRSLASAIAVLVVVALAGFAPQAATSAKPAAAGVATFNVDPVHSSALFRIKHINASWFHGTFNEMSGSFKLDPAAKNLESIEITIKADSIDTRNEQRDGHVKSAEFFDVAKFPTMTFKSTKVAKSPAGFDVTGDLTFHGVTKSITVPVEYSGFGEHPMMGARAGLETVFTIKRSDYGMGAMLDMLGDDVRLTFSTEGIRQ
jgi:polyisoprenoid-binding protein YceI